MQLQKKKFIYNNTKKTQMSNSITLSKFGIIFFFFSKLINIDDINYWYACGYMYLKRLRILRL